MPITLRFPIRRFSQSEFAEVSFEVMRHMFAIHNEIGRFFNEGIYKQELSNRLPGVRLEEPIDVTFGSYRTQLFVDAIVADGALFEFKAVEALGAPHRAQLLHYLLLCDVAHGKLINVRPEDIEHEYVNTQWTFAGRRHFGIDCSLWDPTVPAATELYDFLIALLRDLGTGLEIPLYDEVVAHHFGSATTFETEVPVVLNGRHLGLQRFRLISPGVAVKITSFERRLEAFEIHARRLLPFVDLRAIAWVNITMKQVTFTMLER